MFARGFALPEISVRSEMPFAAPGSEESRSSPPSPPDGLTGAHRACYAVLPLQPPAQHGRTGSRFHASLAPWRVVHAIPEYNGRGDVPKSALIILGISAGGVCVSENGDNSGINLNRNFGFNHTVSGADLWSR